MSSNNFNKLALTTSLPIDFYINRINNRLVFKIKDVYKLCYLTSRNYKKKIDKRKNGENVPSLKVFQVVLVQSNLVDNQYL